MLHKLASLSKSIFPSRKSATVHHPSPNKQIPVYTGLKDFARGVNKLAKMYGDVPVFLSVRDDVAPFGIALLETGILEGKDAIVFYAGKSEKEGRANEN